MPKSKSAIELFINDMKPSFVVESDTMGTGDLKKFCTDTITHVEDFCTSNNLTTTQKITNNSKVFVSNENYDVEGALSTFSGDAIYNLIASCGIPKDMQFSAAASIVNVMGKYFSAHKNSDYLFSLHNKKVEEFDIANAKVMSLEDLFPSELMNTLAGGVYTEDFGAGISKTIPDLRMAITITIMQFHQGITARLVPVKVATEPVIQYKREDYKIYNVADPESLDKDLIDLCKDPKPITNEAIKILVLKANDSGTEPALVRDNVIRFSAVANILQLSIDDTKYGHGRINRTDMVAEGPELEKVYFTITNGATTEEFAIDIPYTQKRLVYEMNSVHSAMRAAHADFTVFVNKNTLKSNGTANTILAAIPPEEGFNVSFTIKPSMNLRNGETKTLGDIKMVKYHTVDNTLISADLNTLAGAATYDLVGYSLDAKFDEQNIRKSQIATRIQTRQIVQVIPPSKNYIVETAMSQSEEDNGASRVVQVIKIGQDDKTLTTIDKILKQVYDMGNQMFANPLKKGFDPGHNYAAGSLVKPRVKIIPLKADDVVSMKDSDRMSDIRSQIQMKISNIVENLLNDTMLTQQLPAGQKPVFRVACSRVVMNTLFAVPHIHNHLDGGTTTPSYDGVEFRRVLDSGVTLEFATTLFNYMYDEIIFIPYIPGAPDSILNWGHNHDHGTVIGNYNHTQDTAAWNRMFASVREITLPTNPLGIIIKIQDIDKAIRLAS